ncbi:hypoxia inducible factor 1 subunit alpha, like 2 isoform X2 [Colossoma macropomum]|uniref:hypoxia inducible factor 1 subunit alpha, like 2 isoform X2 n=1 Tax=Colossoma macropomum TaxID=42526 RepID=UPI001864C304|nr:hypoxia inducible factor 1 subunit alpha, like 2 isoform X2 [Colossoma macropomum]
MITEQLQTVLKDSFEHKLQVKQKCKQKVSEQKKARVCTEWRKARSRVAARSRREKESQLFREIAALLPLAPNVEAQLDKASVIRLTIAYLRLRALLDSPASSTAPATAQHLSSRQGEPAGVNERWFHYQTLGGFLLIVSLNGKIIFTTKDATSHTGINQMDLIGRSLFDFLHPCDQKELKEILTKLIGSPGQQKCDIFLRIKGATNHKLTPWKVIHCTGVKKSSYMPGCSCLLLLCRSLPVQDIIEREAYLNFKAFLSIHGPEMKFTYCHSGVLELTGFSDTELCGQSVYQYYHPYDCQHILQAHLCLLVKGQVCTGKYRLLQKHGGYVWVETDATVVYNIRTGKPESVVCINYVLSGVEMADVVFSLEQTQCLPKPQDTLQPKVCTSITTSSTTDKHTSSVLPHYKRDGAASGHSEITQKSPACNSLTCVEHNSPVPSSQNKTHQWKTGITNVSQHPSKSLGKYYDEPTACSRYQNPPGSVPWAPVYSKLPWCPPAPFFKQSTQNTAEKMVPVQVGLPILSGLECELNAPLGPTSQLLQGTELTTVLDQVAPGVSWY